MSFYDCMKKSFTCINEIKNLTAKGSQLTSENLSLKAKLEAVEANLYLSQHYASADRFVGLPQMEQMIDSGRAKLFSVEGLRAQWASQFGMTLDRGATASTIGVTKTLHRDWEMSGYSGSTYPMWRIPKGVFLMWLKATPIELWTYRAYSANLVNTRSFMCQDFSQALLGEKWLSPYWDMCFGIVHITNHALNLFWPSDENTIYYCEPQADGLRVPNINQSGQKPRTLYL